MSAIAQGRAIFKYNIQDFVALAKLYPKHGSSLLAFQKSMTLNETIAILDRVLRETGADEWVGQVRWLNDWKS